MAATIELHHEGGVTFLHLYGGVDRPPEKEVLRRAVCYEHPLPEIQEVVDPLIPGYRQYYLHLNLL